MTKRQLKTHLILIIGYVSILIAVAAFSFYKQERPYVYQFIREMSSLLIALPAAYLTYCLQRRQAHLTSLRELWKEANDAKGCR